MSRLSLNERSRNGREPIIMLGVAIALLLLAALWFLQGQRSNIRRHGKRLPRPPGTLPFAGNGFWFLQPRHKLLDWFAQVQPEAGFDTYEISVPSLPPAIWINNPKNLEHVLKNNELFIKGDFFRSRSWDLFGNGIINADGELWKVQRKAGLRFFSNANLKTFIDEVLPPMLADTIRTLDMASQTGSVIDLQSVLLELTTRLMGKMAYEMDIHGSLPFSESFDFASGAVGDRFTNPFWRVKEVLFGRRLRKAVKAVKDFGRRVVSEAVTRRDNMTGTGKPQSGSHTNSLQENLINSLLDHISDHQVVADSAMNFLSAGRDTTAQSLTWTFYQLMRHPSHIKQIRREIRDLQMEPMSSERRPEGAPPREVLLSFSLINSNSLPYTHATFSETLRLCPPVPFELKEAIAPSTFPDGTVLPASSVVLWVPWSMGRSPLIWGSDAMDFRPTRWLTKPGEDTYAQDKTSYENPVFNAGPRACLGKRMAELLAVYVIASLWWQYDFEEVLDVHFGGCGAGKERISQNSLTLPMEGGLPVRVRQHRPGGC